MRTPCELREATGLTGGQLAAMIAVTAGPLASWEHGQAWPDTRQVGQLALALGVTPVGVLAGLHPQPPAPGKAPPTADSPRLRPPPSPRSASTWL